MAVTKIICVERKALEKLIEGVKTLEDDYTEVCVGYDLAEPKLVLVAYDDKESKEETIEIRYDTYQKVLEMLTEVIRIYNMEKIKDKISRYENRIEKIKEKMSKRDDQDTLKLLPKYGEMLKRLESKIKVLQEQIQNPEKIEPELTLGEIDDIEEFLDTIKAPQDVKQLFEHYKSGKFIDDGVKLPVDVCDDYEPGDIEVDISDPYWCVRDEFEIGGYLVFQPAKKAIKLIMSITSDEFKELERDVPLYTMRFNDAFSILKFLHDYHDYYEDNTVAIDMSLFYERGS
jgi:hypothetical protein